MSMDRPMTDVERATEIFKTTVYATEVTGVVIDEIRPDYCRCHFDIDARHMNTLGIVMGGAVFTLADFAFGICANFDKDVFVTASADSHFLAPAKGKRLIAEAREIRSGRRTCLFSVTVTDELGTDVAYFTFSGIHAGERKKT